MLDWPRWVYMKEFQVGHFILAGVRLGGLSYNLTSSKALMVLGHERKYFYNQTNIMSNIRYELKLNIFFYIQDRNSTLS